jgi:hypothetical protein
MPVPLRVSFSAAVTPMLTSSSAAPSPATVVPPAVAPSADALFTCTTPALIMVVPV